MKARSGRTGILFLAAATALAVHGANALAWQQAPAAPPPAAAPAPAPGSDDADAIILDRQLVMQQLDKDTKALGEIAAGTMARDNLQEYAGKLAKGAREAQTSFAQNVPGGGAKPEVWTNSADFSKRMQAFVDGADKLVAGSGNPDMLVIGTLMVDALPCKQCHDLYRIKK